VLEVIRAVERVSGRKVPVRLDARRPGDPPVLVAASGRIAHETGWQPRFIALDEIVDNRPALADRASDGYGQPA